jgi:uncharacterized membrane protein
MRSETVAKKVETYVYGRPLGLALLAFYKGAWGILEILAGVLVLFSHRIFSGELTEDPQDLFANWLFAHLGVNQARQLGAVIILLGAVKIAIALGAWYRSWRMRNFALIFFSAAAAFAAYEIISRFTLFRLGALIMDLFFLYYFWKVLPKHLLHKDVS